MGGSGEGKRFACGSVIPGCDAIFTAQSEEQLLQQVADHAKAAHGMESVDAATVELVRGKIEPVD